MSDVCEQAETLGAGARDADRRLLFGAEITELSRPALTELMTAGPAPVGGGVRLLVTMNLDHVVRLQTSAPFRAAYGRGWMVTADGAPVHLYGRLKGLPIARVTGSDLLADLVQRFDPVRHRPFFVVSGEGTETGLRGLFAAHGFAADAVGFRIPPFGFEKDNHQSAELASAIVAHRATHLIFGLGAPKSEVWIDTHRAVLGDLYACCFGSGPDFLVGAARRAPELLQRLGLEWAWRVASDPKRLWRRYFVDSWAFLPAVVRDLRGRSPGE